MVTGVVGFTLSILMRIELQNSGLQLFANPHMDNVVMPSMIGGFGNWC